MNTELWDDDLDNIAALLRDVQALADTHKVGFKDITVYVGGAPMEVIIGLDGSGSSYVVKEIR